MKKIFGKGVFDPRNPVKSTKYFGKSPSEGIQPTDLNRISTILNNYHDTLFEPLKYLLHSATNQPTLKILKELFKECRQLDQSGFLFQIQSTNF